MRPIQSSRGFSLVELLIGMLIALFGIIAVSQVFAVSERQKRVTTGGGSAQQNGNIALMTMERAIRMAGYGFNDAKALGCTVRAHHTLDNRDFNFIFAPVVIKQGNNGAPDEVIAIHGSSNALSVASVFAPVAGVPRMQLKNRAGYAAGDLVVATGAGSDGGALSDLVCALSQVSVLPDAPGELDMIVHDQTAYSSSTGQTTAPLFNKPGGVGVSFTSSGLLFNLGEQPVLQRYSVQSLASGGAQLRATDLLTDQTAPIADEIIDLQAQYGIDATGAGGVVSSFVDELPAPITKATWSNVLALRIAVLVRSKEKEKPDANGKCFATTVPPRWSGADFKPVISTTDWQCYRYGTYETVVPLRNMLWKAK
jgi:type IV pilus assembly protein PilW